MKAGRQENVCLDTNAQWSDDCARKGGADQPVALRRAMIFRLLSLALTHGHCLQDLQATTAAKTLDCRVNNIGLVCRA